MKVERLGYEKAGNRTYGTEGTYGLRNTAARCAATGARACAGYLLNQNENFFE